MEKLTGNLIKFRLNCILNHNPSTTPRLWFQEMIISNSKISSKKSFKLTFIGIHRLVSISVLIWMYNCFNFLIYCCTSICMYMDSIWIFWIQKNTFLTAWLNKVEFSFVNECFLVFSVLRHPRCNPFKALKVMLISKDRVDLWTSLLSMGGAAKVHHHKENEDMSGG